MDVFEQTLKSQLDRCFAGEQVTYGEWLTNTRGRVYHVRTYTPLRSPSAEVNAALISARDLTEHMLAVEALQNVQAELAHVTRVTTLGELAASIAHEVNQPLAAIVADANACLNWLATPNPRLDMVREALDAMLKDGHRAADVIQRIRQLATKSVPRKAALDVNDVVRDVIPLVRAALLRHEVSLRLDLASALPPVVADRVQLQQVILNLVMNAIEAMGSVTGRSRELIIRAEPHDRDHVRVTVQDTGVGIGPNTVDKLFGAFFTTKRGGMGMVLSCQAAMPSAPDERQAALPLPPARRKPTQPGPDRHERHGQAREPRGVAGQSRGDPAPRAAADGARAANGAGASGGVLAEVGEVVEQRIRSEKLRPMGRGVGWAQERVSY
jgi:signal transduction histidine kinase